MITPEKKDKLSTVLSAWEILLGALAILVLVLENKGVIEKEKSQFVAEVLLSVIALSAGVFSIYTKSAPYRGGVADKEENPFSYYFMTAIWILAFIFFSVMALRAYIGSH